MKTISRMCSGEYMNTQSGLQLKTVSQLLRKNRIDPDRRDLENSESGSGTSAEPNNLWYSGMKKQ